MIHDETLSRIEYTKVLALIAGYVHCPATGTKVSALRPLNDPEEISRRFVRFSEAMNLFDLAVPLPLAPFDDIRSSLDHARPVGAILNPDELLPFRGFLATASALARFFSYRQDIPALLEVAGDMTGLPELAEVLGATLSDSGEILDSASRELYELRVRKRSLTLRIRKRLEEIVRERETALFLQDDFITQRSGRWVIPVRMDSKGMVQGVVHDVSNTGETAFMEPIEIIGMANELENLAAEEKREMIRILQRITAWIRDEADSLSEQFAALVNLDLCNAIASFARRTGSEIPTVTGERTFSIRQGRHPLLLVMAEDSGKEVVPLDLRLSEDDRIMVITGPNTGGKTVALKTVGLLQAMALTGMPVPAAGTSVFPLVQELLADIGDDQSIEQNLSTFSAHVAKLSQILRQAGQTSLILLDELGTGTEPGQGAALSCAILEELSASGALVIATTHLADIIGFVHRTSGMQNASMAFDRATLSPLYRLEIGSPGESHALDIARRYGMPERIITRAASLTGRLESEFHRLLADLKEEQERQVLLTHEMEQQSRLLAADERAARNELAELEARARQSLTHAWEEAKGIVMSARREINTILEEARREKNRAGREKLAELEKKVSAALTTLSPDREIDPASLREGDLVFVRSIGYDAEVIACDRKTGRLKVRAGSLEIAVPLAEVSFPKGKKARTHQKAVKEKVDDECQTSLNIIGQRVDDALQLVDRFLNRASVEGLSELRIIHGKGTGVLRRAVRDYLASHPLVREAADGDPLQGGNGMTTVLLR